MLDAELDSHLENEKHEKTTNGNYRNGHGTKKIESTFGESEIKVPRDREGSFEPALVPKRHNVIDGLENIIISLYAKGMSVSGIEEQICEMYGFEVSTSTISRTTSAVAGEVTAWQNRPLDDLYLIVWMDGIVFKVRENSKAINKTIYLCRWFESRRQKRSSWNVAWKERELQLLDERFNRFKSSRCRRYLDCRYR